VRSSALRAVACDGEVLNIDCYDGDTIKIISASYGRRDNVTCPTDNNDQCVYSETRKFVTDRWAFYC